MIFRIQNNTDQVDIDSKCLGLSVWVPGDSLNLLNSNRGLHIQIRHNKNPETFEAASKLSQLLSAAPELLAMVKYCRGIQKAFPDTFKATPEFGEEMDALIKKAGD